MVMGELKQLRFQASQRGVSNFASEKFDVSYINTTMIKKHE
jgi:hypothetical protein